VCALGERMYLLTVQNDQAVVEASLGGRVDALEMRAFGEDLAELLESLGNQSYYLLIDHSKAKSLDREAVSVLSWIKDTALETGAEKVVCIARDEADMVNHTTYRIQAVLEGREEFHLEGDRMSFPAWQEQSVRMAA
jgi:hypothetical protein